ncbi:MAG: AAA family ATPase [Clostridia bacterium]|nr:AAA family ATPase [Clostridia bacterium]
MFPDIQKMLLSKPNAVIAIDGCCASGKTTLAKKLADEFNMQIIHMDDFFLPFDMRSSERLNAAGGNVHYERFAKEVCGGIMNKKPFEYRIFSCQAGDYIGTATVDPQKPIIVEGAYCLHPEIPDIYDLKIFVNTDYETQLERILGRNGKDALEAFKTKWIPYENRYFAEFGIKNKCDVIIENK